MRAYLMLGLLFYMSFTSCISDISSDEHLPKLENKKVRFEFYTDKDFSKGFYDDHFLNLSVGVTLLDILTGESILILEENTSWISFKDIPRENSKLKFEKSIERIDTERFRIVYGYSYQVRIGDTIQMQAKIETLQRWETDKLIPIKF